MDSRWRFPFLLLLFFFFPLSSLCAQCCQLANGRQWGENPAHFLQTQFLTFAIQAETENYWTSLVTTRAQHVTVTVARRRRPPCTYTVAHPCKRFQANLKSAALDSQNQCQCDCKLRKAAYGGTRFEFLPASDAFVQRQNIFLHFCEGVCVFSRIRANKSLWRGYRVLGIVQWWSARNAKSLKHTSDLPGFNLTATVIPSLEIYRRALIKL